MFASLEVHENAPGLLPETNMRGALVLAGGTMKP